MEDSSSIMLESSGIWWNLVKWMHSCRNLWGIKKYRPCVVVDVGVASSSTSVFVDVVHCCPFVSVMHC